MLSAGLLETPDRHAARIIEMVKGAGSAALAWPETSNYPVKSWQRCIEDFRLDPSSKLDVIPYVGPGKLNIARDRLGEDLSIASDELTDLFAAVRGIGYCASFANDEGLFVLERADRDSACYVSTDQPGWLWSERIGGTNSVGTCIIEQKVTSVFGRQHFFMQCADTACAGAPVFNASGALAGVLSITTRNKHLGLQTHLLATNVVGQSALRLSARIFRRAFAASTIIEWRLEHGGSCLIAVNSDQRIEGANAAARKTLGLANGDDSSQLLWNLFEKNDDLRRAKIHGGMIELKGLEDRHVFHANVSPATGASKKFILRGKNLPAAAERRSVEYISLDECAGGDPAMLNNVNILRRIRHAGLPILLLGETGTGKDTLARAIHADSERAAKPFLAFNCAAVPESLIDSELFGYAPGTFTGGSTAGNRGRVMEADGGTLFLDEIGDMPVMLQTRLLRVLESREVVALGSGVGQKVDITVIAATNQDLQSRVSHRLFREDLYYRLAGAVIPIPALRDRADIRSLIENILARISNGEKKLKPRAMDALLEHRWPGNIRELTHVLRRATSIACDGWIMIDDLMLPTANPATPARKIPQPVSAATNATKAIGYDAVHLAESDTIRLALDCANGDVAAAAGMLNMSRATLYRKMQRHNLHRR